jgi:hypothetical protein
MSPLPCHDDTLGHPFTTRAEVFKNGGEASPSVHKLFADKDAFTTCVQAALAPIVWQVVLDAVQDRFDQGGRGFALRHMD